MRSLNLEAGDEILVSDQVYGGVYQALLDLISKSRSKIVVQPVDREQSPDDIAKAFLEGASPHTKISIIDEIASPTGLVFPVGQIVKELRSQGVITIVDGAHAPGTFDLNVKELGADFWVGNFHKWVCSPRGAAGFVVAPEMRDLIRPAVVTWDQPEGYPTSFAWQGTDDYSAMLCVPAAIEFMDSLGWERIRNHNQELVTLGGEMVSQGLGLPLVEYQDNTFRSMRLVRLPEGLVADQNSAWRLGARISRGLRVEVPAIAWRQGFIRLSAQVYNHPAEYEQLAEGLPQLLEQFREER